MASIATEEGPGVGPAAADRREVAFRVALGVATLTMLALCWPLWAGSGGTFPRVPFVPGLPEPPWLRGLLFAILLGTIAVGMARRGWLPAGLPALAYLIAGDQHRLQPWIYQYALMALALGTMPRGRALGPCRVVLVALYFHSGLSKLDATFPREVGSEFLARLAGPLGADPASWPGPFRAAAALAMPLGEMLIGVGLILPATRAVALAGAVLMHAALIAILGPWGLDHSTIVVVWNAALIVEGLILFAATGPHRPASAPGRLPGRSLPAVAVVALAAALPLLERRGWWDSWPSFALYASHAERAYVYLHEDGVRALPGAIRRHLRPPPLGDPWHRVDLTSWSRSERGTPPYPQARAAVGVAEALAGRVGSAGLVRVVAWGRAGRFTGRRTRWEAVGPQAIRRLADRYAINAHPARKPG